LNGIGIMKRVIDFIGSVLGIIILSPLYILLAIMVRIKLGSPVFFRQQRGGLDGRSFKIIKFRTMTDLRDLDGELLSDEERLNRFSRFLRSTSLDELPELYNILKGDMSFIGPRPLLSEYLNLYTDEQARRHEIKPGITGWAQVNGRNQLTWEERFNLDVWYVEHRSLSLDLRVLLKTVVGVISRKGISAEDHDSMPKFTGAKA